MHLPVWSQRPVARGTAGISISRASCCQLPVRALRTMLRCIHSTHCSSWGLGVRSGDALVHFCSCFCCTHRMGACGCAAILGPVLVVALRRATLLHMVLRWARVRSSSHWTGATLLCEYSCLHCMCAGYIYGRLGGVGLVSPCTSSRPS